MTFQAQKMARIIKHTVNGMLINIMLINIILMVENFKMLLWWYTN